MTEKEWMKCSEPMLILDFLQESGKASERKLQLFDVACCRRGWHLLKEEQTRKAVNAVEEYADGLITLETVDGWLSKVREVFQNLPRGGYAGWTPEALACDGVRIATQVGRIRDNTHCVFGKFVVAIAGASGSKPLSNPWHDSVRKENLEQCRLLRDIFGNPFNPCMIENVWKQCIVKNLAQSVYDARSLPDGVMDADRLAVLADALEDAGCTDTNILGHLRGPGPHIRGCWVLDALLAKE